MKSKETDSDNNNKVDATSKNYPKFVWFEIFSYLKGNNLKNAKLVNKNWLALLQEKKILEQRTSQKVCREIPNDIWKIIFSKLDVKDKFNVGMTYKFWQPVVNDESIWIEECKKRNLTFKP